MAHDQILVHVWALAIAGTPCTGAWKTKFSFKSRNCKNSVVVSVMWAYNAFEYHFKNKIFLFLSSGYWNKIKEVFIRASSNCSPDLWTWADGSSNCQLNLCRRLSNSIFNFSYLYDLFSRLIMTSDFAYSFKVFKVPDVLIPQERLVLTWLICVLFEKVRNELFVYII